MRASACEQFARRVDSTPSIVLAKQIRDTIGHRDGRRPAATLAPGATQRRALIVGD
jgi:hypothetical protein